MNGQPDQPSPEPIEPAASEAELDEALEESFPASDPLPSEGLGRHRDD
jgi:hypothetical protein